MSKCPKCGTTKTKSLEYCKSCNEWNCIVCDIRFVTFPPGMGGTKVIK